MGAGIAEVCARAGLDVVVRERTAEAASAGQRRMIEAGLLGRKSGRGFYPYDRAAPRGAEPARVTGPHSSIF